jgi:hypothetical protein
MATAARVLERLERSRVALAALYLLWCAVTLYTIAHHEAWRDEADSWLMARDNTLHEIWRIMRYAGTPMLLYVVEKPFIALGLPYTLQWFVSWPFAAAAVWLVIYRTRLTWPSRLVVVFSYFFVYEWAVVVRGYAMTIFFILLVCVLHPRRKGGNFAIGIALFCAANATAFGLLFACAYAGVAGVDMVLVREERKLRVLAAQAIGWLGILVSLAQLLPEPKDGQGTQTPRLGYLSTAFAGSGLPAGPHASLEVRSVAAWVMIIATVWLVRKNRRALGVFALFTLALSYLFYAKHVGYVRHWGFYLVAAVAARVIACDDESELDTLRLSKVSVLAWLLTLGLFGAWCVEGVRMSWADDVGLFTNAKAMARYISGAHLEQRDMAGQSPTSAEAVLPYLEQKKTLYYPSIDRVSSNMIWDKALADNGRIRFPEIIERIRKRYRNASDPDRGVLLLWSGPIPAPDLARYCLREIHVEHGPVMSTNGESFWLYGPDGSGDRLDPSP